MNNREGSVGMSLDESSMEERIQNAGLTAPRITPEHVDSQIACEHYINAGRAVQLNPDSPLHLLTICVLELRNGFVVTGESACASPENFNEQIGRDIAKRNARDKIWSLEGYLLRTTLAAAKRDQVTAINQVGEPS